MDIPGVDQSYDALMNMRAKPRTVEEARKEKGSGGFKMKVLNIRYTVIEDNKQYFLFDRSPDYRSLLFYPVQ